MTKETDLCRNEHSSCVTVVPLDPNVKTYPTRTMQSLEGFENGCNCIHLCLLDTVY